MDEPVNWWRRIFIWSLIIVLTALSAWQWGGWRSRKKAGEETEKQVVKIAMGYIPNIQFAPFYVAASKGYFTEEGLEAEFDYGWEKDNIQLLGKNEIQLAVGSGEQVALARAQGLPVKMVANWYRRFPVAVAALEEEGIREPKDLEGKTVGIPALHGASFIGWQALMESAEVDENQIDLKVIGYTQVESLTEGVVEAVVVYAMNEPVQLELNDYEIDLIEVADWANLVSNGILTNEQTMQENPELVAKVVQAFLRGLSEVMVNPEEALELSKAFVEGLEENQSSAEKILEKSIEFWRAEKLGWAVAEDWQRTVEVMEKAGLIETELAVEDLFTNEFIDE